MTSPARTALLLSLATAYVVVSVRPGLTAIAGGGFDALAPESRFVEQAIGEHRFGAALPVALSLRRAHGGEPLVAAYWLSLIYQGLGRTADARTASGRLQAPLRIARRDERRLDDTGLARVRSRAGCSWPASAG